MIIEADDAPPNNIISHFVQLLCKFVENGRATLSVECATIVVHKLHLLLALQFVHVDGLSFLIQFWVATSFLSNLDITFSLASDTFAITSFAVITAFQVVQLLLRFFHFLLFLHGLARLSSTDFAISFKHVGRTALLSSTFELGRLLLLVNHAPLFHACFIITTIALFIVQVVIVIIQVHELLVDLEVLMSGALLE